MIHYINRHLLILFIYYYFFLPVYVKGASREGLIAFPKSSLFFWLILNSSAVEYGVCDGCADSDRSGGSSVAVPTVNTFQQIGLEMLVVRWFTFFKAMKIIGIHCYSFCLSMLVQMAKNMFTYTWPHISLE